MANGPVEAIVPGGGGPGKEFANPTTSLPRRSGGGQQPDEVARWRWLFAGVIVLVALGYAGAVLGDKLKENQKIDTSVLALLAFAGLAGVLLVKPGLLQHVLEFKALGISFKLREVEEQQAKQQEQLEYFGLTLAALLPPPEQAHILKLEDEIKEDGTILTAGYRFTRDLRSQLSHLRSLGLIKMQPDPNDKDRRKHLSNLPQQGEFDVADWVKLTDLGHRWAARIKEIDARAARAAHR
jgi:hypothetical protein